jgi:hypothetical protein
MRNNEGNILSCHCDDGSAVGTTNVKQMYLMWCVRALCLAYKDSIEMLLGMFEEAPRNSRQDIAEGTVMFRWFLKN